VDEMLPHRPSRWMPMTTERHSAENPSPTGWLSGHRSFGKSIGKRPGLDPDVNQRLRLTSCQRAVTTRRTTLRSESLDRGNSFIAVFLWPGCARCCGRVGGRVGGRVERGTTRQSPGVSSYRRTVDTDERRKRTFGGTSGLHPECFYKEKRFTPRSSPQRITSSEESGRRGESRHTGGSKRTRGGREMRRECASEPSREKAHGEIETSKFGDCTSVSRLPWVNGPVTRAAWYLLNDVR